MMVETEGVKPIPKERDVSPWLKLVIASSAFSVAAHCVWNSLPSDVTRAEYVPYSARE